MADQITVTGTVATTRRIRGEWGAVKLATDQYGDVRATGDIAHLSRGDEAQALGRWRETKYGREFQARAIMPTDLLPALAEIEAVTDRFQPRKPSRGAVLGLVIRLGSSAAATMKRNPFLPVVDLDREVKGWGYGSGRAVRGLGWHPGRRRGTRCGRRRSICGSSSVTAAWW